MLNRQPVFISLLGLTIGALGGCAGAPSATSSPGLHVDRPLVVPHGFVVQQAEQQVQPLSAEQAQQQLPGRISAEDASRLLVFINPSQVATPSAETTPDANTASPDGEAPAAEAPPAPSP